jgi:glycosyltransferase involved in cell wall biosynthesis
MVNILGALIMVKNEEESIRVTIDSTKNIINDIIVYDTGSTDNTIQIIKDACKKNNQRLHLKRGIFTTFPQSRNESIIFAETVDVENLLLMDAGDELECKVGIPEIMQMMHTLPHPYKFGSICLKWLEEGVLTEHNDVRFIKNNQGCRYDNKFPVHEEFAGLNANTMIVLPNVVLYQNRDRYAGSTPLRVENDIQLLLTAEPCTRNYYYLAQSYLFMKDYQNCFKYNLLALKENMGEMDNGSIYSRLGYCAIECKMDSPIVIKYLKLAVQDATTSPISSYLNLMQYCLEMKLLDVVIPYLEKIASLDKTNEHNFNHENYDYTRWVFIYQICYLSQTNFELGKFACEKAVAAKSLSRDIVNLECFNKLSSPSTI